jgi:hypothetical protein
MIVSICIEYIRIFTSYTTFMKSIIIIFLFLLSISANCQKKVVDSLDNLVSETRILMKEKKISNYFIYTISSFSNVEAINEKNEDAGSYLLNDFKAYIFWKENSKCFIKAVDKNYKYQTLEIDECNFININKKTIDLMSKEIVLPLAEVDNGKKVLIIQPIQSTIKFYFSQGNTIEFPHFYLNDLNKRNINYSSNSKLKINKLFQECQKLIYKKWNEIYKK